MRTESDGYQLRGPGVEVAVDGRVAWPGGCSRSHLLSVSPMSPALAGGWDTIPTSVEARRSASPKHAWRRRFSHWAEVPAAVVAAGEAPAAGRYANISDLVALRQTCPEPYFSAFCDYWD
jgi:hypothetical protein